MVWTCRAQHRLDCRSTQAECGCTEKIWQAKEIMGWSAGEWRKEARYGFCWPSEPFWVERTPSRKTCQKAQPLVEENRALKWIWWWWYPRAMFKILYLSNRWFYHILKTQVSNTRPVVLWLLDGSNADHCDTLFPKTGISRNLVCLFIY